MYKMCCRRNKASVWLFFISPYFTVAVASICRTAKTRELRERSEKKTHSQKQSSRSSSRKKVVLFRYSLMKMLCGQVAVT